MSVHAKDGKQKSENGHKTVLTRDLPKILGALVLLVKAFAELVTKLKH